MTETKGMPPPIRVLVVEDNPGFSYHVKDMLQRQHTGRFEVSIAVTLAGALELARQQPFDVILLDLGLPDSIGFATFHRAREMAPESAIIVLTVIDDEDVALRSVREGAQDYLVKDQVVAPLLARSVQYAVERVRAEREVRELSGRLLRYQDDERRRLARELHDVTAQNVAALTMNLALLRDHVKSETGHRLLEDARKLAEQSSQELRTMSYLLHPPLLDELGLAGAMKDYVDGFSKRSGIATEIDLDREIGRLPPECETALFRVLQESLSNVHRHSGSKTVAVFFGRKQGRLVLEVRDRGKGMSGPVTGQREALVGVGLAGMRERMRQLGGRLDILAGKPGTVVHADLPETQT